MKTWQDRGEVLDSEDEDASQDVETQASERARKRQRLEHDADEKVIGAQEVEGRAWSYGKAEVEGDSGEHALNEDGSQEGRDAGPDDTSIRPGESHTVLQDISGDGLDSELGEDPQARKTEQIPDVGQYRSIQDGDQEELWMQPRYAATYGRKNLFPRSQFAKEDLNQREAPEESSKEASRSLAVPPQQSNLGDEAIFKPILSSQSNDTEELPDVREIFARNQVSKDHEHTLSGASSPLSERDVSPPAPLMRLQAASYTARQNDMNELVHVEIPIEDLPDPGSRRNFRMRKEKQLHPYMFDKAQYQKQCRERGMRPIRYVEQTAAETQDTSLSGSQEASQASHLDSSQPRRQDSMSGEDRHVNGSDSPPMPNPSNSDEELPRIRPPFQPVSGNVQKGLKRRKLFHSNQPKRMSAAQQSSALALEEQDEFSIPPSPPPTSSDSTDKPISKAARAVFRMPRGLTPAPLPTPQISSETRVVPRAEAQNESESDSLPRRSRPSTASRPRPKVIPLDSATESSEEEPDPKVDDRYLDRQRKRIKGVLPASWLRIDFRAQQKQQSPSPSRRRRNSSTSPPPTAPQKGVAQRVISKRSGSPRQSNATLISDDDGESDVSHGSPSPPKFRQARLDFDRQRESTAPTSLVDDERMEVDWVDPMPAGGSRPRHESGTKRKRRQPRISDAFGPRQASRDDFAEERKAFRHAVGATSKRKSKGRTHYRHTPRKPTMPRLSILDAPAEITHDDIVPQFVRIARRRARAEVGYARHSPSNKHIRLATKDDTEDAASVLQAWRQGTIEPRQVPPKKDVTAVDLSTNEPEELKGPTREPLRDLQNNQQLRLQPALRKSSGDPPVKSQNPPAIRPVAQSNTGTSTQPEQSNETPLSNNKQRDLHKRQQARIQPQKVHYRAAQLEAPEQEFALEHRAAAFERRMHLLSESVARPQRDSVRNIQLARFLENTNAAVRPSPLARHAAHETTANCDDSTTEGHVAKTTIPHRPRKRQPRRIDADARVYRQPSEPLPEVINPPASVEQSQSADAGPKLHGLWPFGTRYPTDFDILPLATGTYFHESTFIGSDDFAASLNLAGRSLDIPTGRIRIHVENEIFDWGVWTEDVATELARVPNAVSAAIKSIDEDPESNDSLDLVMSNVDYLLRSTVRYFTRCLAFLDAVDRRQCVQCLQRFVEDMFEVVAEHTTNRDHARELLTRCLQYTLVLARQAAVLSNHSLVDMDVKRRASDLVRTAASKLASQVFPECLQGLRSFYEDNRYASKREQGIRDSDTAVTSVVILRYTLQNLDDMQASFWPVIFDAISMDTSELSSVTVLDKAWYDIFTIQPALEIGADGIMHPGSRLKGVGEDWSLVKRLVDCTLQLYNATASAHGSTINDYIRAILTRCYYLVTRWGWWRCEQILGTVFDFFASRGLALLHKEESRGSPRFLQELHRHPSFEVQAEDGSFHIFLKMLAAGLQGMRNHNTYPDKKIGAIAYRFIPNHGRTYRKDTDVRQADIDALRNHHDLLSVIYYSSPPDHRIRVELISNLVDHSASHREACRLNIRAWSNLASFQASADEDKTKLDPFNVWYRDLLTTTISQYRLARTEVENDVANARAQGQPEVAFGVIEDTIARNQRQIAATLVDALAALKHALQCTSGLEKAWYLVESSKFWQVFDLFDPAARRLHSVLNEALDVVKAALEVQDKFNAGNESQHTSEDSQEYGDSNALLELASTQIPSASPDQSMAATIHGPVAHSVSNVFGADAATDDAVLTHLIKVWTQIAHSMVRSGRRTWNSYLNDYGADSWSQLRDTEQRRKYTPFFLGQVVESSRLELVETGILNSWLRSLVEREATLKFQHVLTNALLNQYSDEPLLHNLPFSRPERERYNISLHDLRQRRLTLLSSVLSNMRSTYNRNMHERPRDLPELRRRYADMLRQLMHAMKSNYQELQTSRNEEVADAYAQGAYVEFVQQVVSFLQQYTTDICPVDRFFTDSAAFPLPATDPMYVVGRLRGYVPKLVEGKKRKELAGFIQAMSERAAVDNQQDYLVNQLVVAMSGTLERGNVRAPTLRAVLLTTVFPAYIENALLTPCSWILAAPILKACGSTIRDLLYDVNLQDQNSIQIAVDTLDILLQSISKPVKQTLDHPGLRALPHTQRALSTMFDALKHFLPTICHVARTTHGARAVAEAISSLTEAASAIEEDRSDFMNEDVLKLASLESGGASPWQDTLEYTRKQVHEKLNQDWYAYNGQYYVKRGNSSVEVVVDLGDEGEEKALLKEAVRSFCDSCNLMFDRRAGARRVLNECSGIGDVVV